MFEIFYLIGCPFSEAALEKLKDQKPVVFYFDDSPPEDYLTEKTYVKKLKGEYTIYKNENKNPPVIFNKQVFKDRYGISATFPRIYKNRELIGGNDDLEKYLFQK